MTEIVYPQDEGEPITVDLRSPAVAGVLAWLWPGAGHLYQRRYAKGMLYMICVLSTFIYGLGLGRGRVVYASFQPGDVRWFYPMQLGVGIPAMPAVIQAFKVQDGGDPYFILCERYPEDYPDATLRFKKIDPQERDSLGIDKTLKDGLMAPPAGPIYERDPDVLGQWHFDYKHMFEIGTLYTIVAGLLNLLVVYDALAGPVILSPSQREAMMKKKNKKLGT